jgi:hypothetical protein
VTEKTMPTPPEPDDSKSSTDIGAAGNVVICAGIIIAIPIYALSTGMQGADLLIAGGALVMGIALEIGFIRTLMTRRQRRQGSPQRPETPRD